MRHRLRHRLLPFGGAILGAALLLIAASGVAAQADLTGTWLTEGGKSRVTILPCGEKFCGSIVWLRDPLDEAGKSKTDARNENTDLRTRPILGLALLQGFAKSGEKQWGGGTIYNPEDGKTYKCTLTLESPDTLEVRGYVGIPLFGKSQTWHRAGP